jgi:hypothetical protein
MESEKVKNLKQIIEKHTVRYEVWPHYEIATNGDRVMVGFDLELYGTHEHGKTSLSPGCHLCEETYADLRHLAESVLPSEQRPSTYEIPPFDASLHESARGVFEVLASIRIEHRHGFFNPVDVCEERCLREMCQKLSDLGVSTGHRPTGP